MTKPPPGNPYGKHRYDVGHPDHTARKRRDRELGLSGHGAPPSSPSLPAPKTSFPGSPLVQNHTESSGRKGSTSELTGIILALGLIFWASVNGMGIGAAFVGVLVVGLILAAAWWLLKKYFLAILGVGFVLFILFTLTSHSR